MWHGVDMESPSERVRITLPGLPRSRWTLDVQGKKTRGRRIPALIEAMEKAAERCADTETGRLVADELRTLAAGFREPPPTDT